MNQVTSIILRRMRAPFLLLISVYSVSILGLVLIPGVDDQGNIWHMSFFHAFYFVSFTATTIGFGEIPYPLSDAQRLWALVIVYISVISWFYALGKIIGLIRDKTFRDALVQKRFKHDVKKIHSPFYLICGFGETGAAVVKSLTEEHFRAVVIEKDIENLSELKLNELLEYVPSIAGDASNPDQLELAGIRHKLCRGVIAATASDKTNLKIAITSKLLHPDVPVVCRSEFKEYEENMLSFGTEYIVNPYETFAHIFEMVMHSASLHLLYDWLTGAPNTQLTEPVEFISGHWIICGYGRFGKNILTSLRHDKDTTITVIDPSDEVMEAFNSSNRNGNYNFIKSQGTDEKTLKLAGVENAAGIIVGADNDSNNLSIIMTATSIQQDILIVARQNQLINHELYDATKAKIVMRPREIVARQIRIIFLAPLLLKFLELARKQTKQWADIAISRLSGIVNERPHLWTVLINQDKTPAVASALEHGRTITIDHITQDPSTQNKKLDCVALLIVRDDQEILLPEDEVAIKAFDRILFCGTREIKFAMRRTLELKSSLNYAMMLKDEPQSFIWRKLHRYFRQVERRKTPR